MHTLWLRFGIILEDYSVEPYSLVEGRHRGPLFHRFLPDGENDAIHLNTADPNSDLKIWFERRGFVDDHGFIQFDYNREEIDETLISKQAVLDAGPFWGLLELRNLSDEQIAAVRENRLGDTHYVALGKRVVKLIQPRVAKLINILRTNYGQYWIDELAEWDSRTQSLGSYLSAPIQAKWSLDNGTTWSRFVPTEQEQHIQIRVAAKPGYQEYLTRDNWQELREVLNRDYEPTLPAFILTRARRLVEQGEAKQALIEAVTTLEVSLNDFISRKVGANQLLSDKVQSFWNLPLPAQVISVAAILGTIPLQEIETVVKVIDVRNKVVHDGSEPPEDTASDILKVLKVAAALLAGPQFKFPTYRHGNWLRTEQEWDQDPSSGTPAQIIRIGPKIDS